MSRVMAGSGCKNTRESLGAPEMARQCTGSVHERSRKSAGTTVFFDADSSTAAMMPTTARRRWTLLAMIRQPDKGRRASFDLGHRRVILTRWRVLMVGESPRANQHQIDSTGRKTALAARSKRRAWQIQLSGISRAT
jgi:hypothetical protein